MEDPNPVASSKKIKSAETIENENPERESLRPIQPPRTRGRPRIEAPKDAKLSAARRLQIRDAQKTHRQKKEAIAEGYKTKIAELEKILVKATELASECYRSSVRSNLQEIHPEISVQLSRLHDHLISTGLSQFSSKQDIMAYEEDPQVPVLNYQECRNSSIRTPLLMDASMQLLLSHPNIQHGLAMTSSWLRTEEKMLGGDITYSFYEPTFSRRLQRYSLEHAYRLFIDPHSDPQDNFRLFRLVPCIRDKAKMAPYFRNLVRASANEPLEISGLPFYTIGGAGHHFPRLDERGNGITPQNTRLPRRLLGLSTRYGSGRVKDEEEERQTQLKNFGLDGEWFDCADVQGYLEKKGIFLESSVLTSYKAVNIVRDVSVDGEFQNFQFHGDDDLAIQNTGGDLTMPNSYINTLPHSFDVDLFMMMIIPGLALLGRVPGFKRTIVESAFIAVMQTQMIL